MKYIDVKNEHIIDYRFDNVKIVDDYCYYEVILISSEGREINTGECKFEI